MSECARDVAGWCRATRPILVGHGMGALVALDWARRASESIAGLVLCSTSAAFGVRDEAIATMREVTNGRAARPFDPKRLAGLSERLLVSHHDNNYAGAVKNLNAVEGELARVTKETPGFLVAGLRERELTFTNSVILHERYFANLGGDGKPAGAVKDAIAAAFGGFPRFEESGSTG